MFGIGANELILILIFGFLIFGPDKMPAMAKTIGQAIRKFRTAQNEMNKVIKEEVYDPNSDEPFKNPLDSMAKMEKKVTGEAGQESFSQRKERYEKQQAAKERAAKLRDRKAAEHAQARREAAASDGTETPGASGSSAGSAADAAAPVPTDREPGAVQPEQKQELDIDELYGIKPVAKKPKAASTAPVRESAATQEAAPAAAIEGEGE